MRQKRIPPLLNTYAVSMTRGTSHQKLFTLGQGTFIYDVTSKRNSKHLWLVNYSKKHYENSQRKVELK